MRSYSAAVSQMRDSVVIVCHTIKANDRLQVICYEVNS